MDAKEIVDVKVERIAPEPEAPPPGVIPPHWKVKAVKDRHKRVWLVETASGFVVAMGFTRVHAEELAWREFGMKPEEFAALQRLKNVARLATMGLRKKHTKQPLQSPFGQWHAGHSADRGDGWVENDLGKYMRETAPIGGHS